MMLRSQPKQLQDITLFVSRPQPNHTFMSTPTFPHKLIHQKALTESPTPDLLVIMITSTTVSFHVDKLTSYSALF